MKLYLIQHGEAVDETVDPDRPLTERGARDVEAVAKLLAGAGVHAGRVWHSGKTRAMETAECVAAHIAPEVKIHQRDGLNPKDPVAPVRETIEKGGQDLVIAGHLPHLSRLASLLLTGDENAELITFRMGGAVCIEMDEAGVWRLLWIVTPDLPHR